MKSKGAYLFPSDLKEKGTQIIRIDAILRRKKKFLKEIFFHFDQEIKKWT